MAIVVLVRHGRTQANVDGILAGWLPGVGLDEQGAGQAARLGERLAGTRLAAIVTSPLQRCRETATAVLAGQGAGTEASSDLATTSAVTVQVDDGLGECRYGAWTGRPIKELAAEPLWRDVQERPSQVTFPAHDDYPAESMAQMQRRAVAAITAHDAAVQEQHGPGAVWVAVSHGDVIKALLADALGTDLDRFQRIVVDPGSVSIVRFSPDRPFVLRVNDTGSDPVQLGGASAAAADGDGDAVVGGGAGTA